MTPEITSSKAAAGSSEKKHGRRRQQQKALKAYVTFLAGDGDYVKGAVGLAKGLRRVGSGDPLVVVVLPDVQDSHRRLLASQGRIVREMEPVQPPGNQTRFATAYYVIDYSRLYVINYPRLRFWQVASRRKIL